MTIRMDEGAAELLDTLHRAGYAAYVVGGCVRDSLLGLTPHDWDLCTSALPQQVMELFGAQRCIPTGLQHGTVTVKQSGALYEITTFRTEGTYTDGRHPDEVHFVPDVREDLARRDFTINAMAYNEKEGLVDPFGGQADLQSGIVRAVGVPRQRFTEDALRILRLYRFAARFGFAIDPPTAQAAQELCAHLDCVSVERIEEELAKLLTAPAPAAYLDKKILLVILPELSSEALAAAKPVVDACPAGEQALPIRLAALLLAVSFALSGCSLVKNIGGSSAAGTKTITRPAVESAELQFTHPAAGEPVAVFDTTAGVFRAVLFPEQAPQAYDNFVGLVQAGYYNGLTVTRVEQDFVVEAGQGADGKGTTIWNGSRYPAEATDKLHHYSGALCMAADSSGKCASVFYIMSTLPGGDSITQELTDQMNSAGYRAEVVSAYQTAGGAPYLDYTDTVLGQVYEGMDVVDTIAQAAVDENQKPTETITINSVSIETYQAQ